MLSSGMQSAFLILAIPMMIFGSFLIIAGAAGWKFALRGPQVEQLGAPTMRVLYVLLGVMVLFCGLWEGGLLRGWLG